MICCLDELSTPYFSSPSSLTPVRLLHPFSSICGEIKPLMGGLGDLFGVSGAMFEYWGSGFGSFRAKIVVKD